jgi:Ca2+-binding RTX toxin-like protein
MHTHRWPIVPLLVVLGVCAWTPTAVSAGARATCFGRQATITGTGLISGTPGNDVIVGSAATDLIDAGAGNDLVCTLDGDDVVFGGLGNDQIDAGASDDTLRRPGQ